MAHLTIQEKYEKVQDRAEAPVGNGAPSQSTNESGATKPTDVWGQMEQDAENKFDKGMAEIEASDKLAQDTINQSTQNKVDELERGKEEKTDEYMQAQEQAYTDYKKQSDPYGVQAEQMAALGLTGSGYSATQQTALFNAYQNRVSSARIGMDKAIREYDIAIAQAKQAGDTDLAKLAVKTLSAKTQLWSNYITEMNTIGLSRYEAQKTSIDWSALLGRLEGEEDFAAALGGNRISTDFYEGALNPDAKYGTFANGYQPDNVGGQKLSKTGKTTQFTATTLKGMGVPVEQNIWETPDGREWVWDGANNKYVAYSDDDPERKKMLGSLDNTLSTLRTNSGVGNYLDDLVAKGQLKQSEADELFEKYYKFSGVEWKLVSGGGVNWGGGIDNNAKYTDPDDPTQKVYTGKELYKLFQERDGLSKDDARARVIQIQTQTGAAK